MINVVEEFRVTELDKETIKVSPIKRESEQIEQGVEAILAQASPIKLRKWPRTEIFKLEQEPESIFSESYIQKTMELSVGKIKTKEEESIQDEFGKLIDKIEEWENETIEQQEKVAKQSSQTESDTQIKAIKKAPIQPKMQSKEKSNVWLAIGVAVLATEVTHALFGGITALLLAFSAVFLVILLYNRMFNKNSTSEVKNPESFLTESEASQPRVRVTKQVQV